MEPKRLRLAYLIYDALWRILTPILSRYHRLKEGIEQRTLKNVDHLKKADIWIQAASVGESYLAWELLGHLNFGPALKILITTNTSQGLDILNQAKKEIECQKTQLAIQCGYFPFDPPSKMNKVVQRVRPQIMVLLEGEIWPGLMRSLKKDKVYTMIVNGRLTEKSLKNLLIWPLLWRFYPPDIIFAISEVDGVRFQKLFDRTPIKVLPNIKFDRISFHQSTTQKQEDQKHLQSLIDENHPFLVLGSVREEEEPDIVLLIQELFRKDNSLIIGLFPRHMHRLSFWENKLSELNIHWSKRSQLEETTTGMVILWDTFGEMAQAFALCHAAFIGGSLAPLGGQNFLEPLAAGITPVIGPHWDNFFWVGKEIFKKNLVLQGNDWQAVLVHLLNIFKDRPSKENVIQQALAYISERQGTTAFISKHIIQKLSST